MNLKSANHMTNHTFFWTDRRQGRVRLKPDGTRWRREGKWRGNWRLECVASALTLPRNVVYAAILTLMRTPRLPAVDWTDAPADLNGLIRFGERRNLVSACVPSRFKRTILTAMSHSFILPLRKSNACAQAHANDARHGNSGICCTIYKTNSPLMSQNKMGIYL